MDTVTRLNHNATDLKGFSLRTPMAIGQVWIHQRRRYVVSRVYPKKVQFMCEGGKVFLTCDQAKFVKHSRLKTD